MIVALPSGTPKEGGGFRVYHWTPITGRITNVIEYHNELSNFDACSVWKPNSYTKWVDVKKNVIWIINKTLNIPIPSDLNDTPILEREPR